jgi:hypothetical protein
MMLHSNGVGLMSLNQSTEEIDTKLGLSQPSRLSYASQ